MSTQEWTNHVKRVRERYSEAGINISYQQALFLAKESYASLKAGNPNPEIKIKEEAIPKHDTFTKEKREKRPMPPIKPQQVAYLQEEEEEEPYEYMPSARPPPSRGRGRPRAAPRPPTVKRLPSGAYYYNQAPPPSRPRAREDPYGYYDPYNTGAYEPYEYEY